MLTDTLQLFVLDASRQFGERVAHWLGVTVAEHQEREFGGGEEKSRPLDSVRGNDVYVIHSLYAEDGTSVNDKLCRLLFFVGALKDAAAARVTTVVPYLAYTRKDSKTNPRDPLTLRYVAAMFEVVGTSSVLTLDVHNVSAFQNAFRCVTEHLDACTLFAKHFMPLASGTEAVVVSPDTGGASAPTDSGTVLKMNSGIQSVPRFARNIVRAAGFPARCWLAMSVARPRSCSTTWSTAGTL